MTRLVRAACAVAIVAAMLDGCGRGNQNLWDMRFPADRELRAITRTELTGYWEGDVSMGGLRLAVQPTKITVALRCDARGEKVAQGSAAMVVDAASARMVLQEDLAGGDADCGFRFNKGDALAYALNGDGLLEVGFAGASVARLVKLADLGS